MGRKSNQSVLKKLLDSVDSGDFKYESREKKVIDWSSYDQAQINEINDMLVYIRDVVDRAVLELHIDEWYECELGKPGQPMVFPGDLVKAILLQQYFQVSNRVSQGLVMLFQEKMDISESFSYKSIERAYGNVVVQKILHHIFSIT